MTADTAAPHHRAPYVPSLHELLRLCPWSPTERTRLRRCHATLQRFAPAPPPYVWWHLGRFVKTLGRLAALVPPQARWLDISSDPWFCLLVQQEFPQVTLTPTGLTTEAIAFRDANVGASYECLSRPLELTAQTTDFGLGDGFDVVSAFEVIEHLQFHPAGFLTAAHGALRPGGLLLLTTPNIASWSAIQKLLRGGSPHLTPLYGGPMEHRKEYSPWEMKQLLPAAGFRLDRLATFNAYLDDRRGLRSDLFWWLALVWHASTFQPVHMRNLWRFSGSTMLAAATRVGPCDLQTVAQVAL